MITKNRLTKGQRLLLRKAMLGIVSKDFSEDMKLLMKAKTADDWTKGAIATILLAQEKFGWAFGSLYAGYLLIYSEPRPRSESDKIARKFRVFLAKLEIWRKRRKSA